MQCAKPEPMREEKSTISPPSIRDSLSAGPVDRLRHWCSGGGILPVDIRGHRGSHEDSYCAQGHHSKLSEL
jgi:hypothetical protein